jgi:hypothetical protein
MRDDEGRVTDNIVDVALASRVLNSDAPSQGEVYSAWTQITAVLTFGRTPQLTIPTSLTLLRRLLLEKGLPLALEARKGKF